MTLLNQFYVVPMVREVRPLSPAWNLMRCRRPWMDVDGWMDEVFGDFVGLIPSHNYNGNNIIAENKKDASGNKDASDNKEVSEKDFLMIANNKNDVSDKNFRVQLDVSQFSPEEINIRVVGRDLVIDGKHEERRDDHGFISRSFSRRYTLPEDLDEQKVACQLSKDGKMLKLDVPRKDAIEYTPQERMIPIQNEPAGDPTGPESKKEAITGTDVKKGA